jgi:cobalt-precorrin-7 (C5)-methyltransferase
VGVGPGDRRLVTPEARDIISKAGIVLGWDMDLLPVRDCVHGKKVFLQDVGNYMRATHAALREARRSGEALAIPRVGDPCLSSGLKGLLHALGGFEVSIHPGISSIQLAAACARIELGESAIVSFHDLGNPDEKKKYLLESFEQGLHLITLSSPDLRPGPMAHWMIEKGVPAQTEALVGSALSLPRQKITRTRLRELVGRRFPWLSVTVIINPTAPSLERDRRLWRSWRQQRTQEDVRRKK